MANDFEWARRLGDFDSGKLGGVAKFRVAGGGLDPIGESSVFALIV
jgi:hypothetical protein